MNDTFNTMDGARPPSIHSAEDYPDEGAIRTSGAYDMEKQLGDRHLMSAVKDEQKDKKDKERRIAESDIRS